MTRLQRVRAQFALAAPSPPPDAGPGLILAARLVETQRWCARYANPEDPVSSLRQVALLPSPALALDPDALSDHLCERPVGLIDHIAAQRRDRLPAATTGEPICGRLIAYHAIESVFDGASEMESSGYLDLADAPPWDTWVAWVPYGFTNADTGYMLAWVPEVFIKLANGGVEVNPVECIRWR